MLKFRYSYQNIGESWGHEVSTQLSLGACWLVGAPRTASSCQWEPLDWFGGMQEPRSEEQISENTMLLGLCDNISLELDQNSLHCILNNLHFIISLSWWKLTGCKNWISLFRLPLPTSSFDKNHALKNVLQCTQKKSETSTKFKSVYSLCLINKHPSSYILNITLASKQLTLDIF